MSLDSQDGRPEDVHDRRRTEDAVLQGLFGSRPNRLDAKRYQRVRALGHGAMGHVDLAEDTVLGRRVALKTLAPERTQDAVSRERIRREAFALAQIDHPAVVGIYDVLEDEGALTLVMEFVEGPTLRTWLEQERPSHELRQVLLETARGISAAHANGIVHRDLKPENVIVQDGLRPKVIDFGVARTGGEQSPGSDGASDEPAGTLTRTGAVLGTPAYMAPEQFLEGEIDARVDQFSFCVMAWEAFVGHRPFAGEKRSEVVDAAARGVVDSSGEQVIPARIRRALRIGLSPEPSGRHIDMQPLVDALRRRRRWPVVVGSIAVVSAAGGLMLSSQDGDSAPPTVAVAPCEGAAAAVGELWTKERASAIESHLETVAPAYGRTLASRLVGGIDAWADQWATQALDACRAHVLSQHRNDQQYESDLRCLDATLGELEAFVVGAQQIPAKRAARIVSALDDVPPPSRCSRPAFVDSAFARARAPQQERALALDKETQSALASGDYPAALASAKRARASVPPRENAAIDADLNLSLARALFQIGDSDAAARAFLDAANAAEASAYDELAASAWLELSRLSSVQRVDAERAAFYVERAEAAVRRLGDPPRLAAVVEQRRAQAEIAAGRPQAAVPHIERGLEIAAKAENADRLRASLAMDLGKVAYMRSDYDSAADAFSRAESWLASAYGHSHPAATDARHNLGSVLVAAGQLERAAEVLADALEGRKKAYGATHEKVAGTLNSIATIAFMRADYARAAEAYAEIIRMRRAARPEPHVSLAEAVANLGRAQVGLRDFAGADQSFAEAVRLLEKLVAANDPRLADALSGWGSAQLARGQHDDAIASYSRALEIRIEALGGDAPRTLRTQIDLAGAERNAGQAGKARRRLEGVRSREGLTPALTVRTELGLGWLAVDARDERTAHIHFEAAVNANRSAGEDADLKERVARATSWIEAHPP